MSKVRILSCRAENLRSYSDAHLVFCDYMVLVGENNEGKSSIFKMLNFLFNKDNDDLLTGKRSLNADERTLWMPANDAHHRARRFSLYIAIGDGRLARPYTNATGGPIMLRVSITKGDMKLRLNVGPPTRGEVHDDRGLELLRLLRNHIEVLLIPAVREANSSRFADALKNQVDHAIEEKLIHAKRGGAPIEYRTALEVIDMLRGIVENNKQSLDIGGGMELLEHMIDDAEIRFEADVNQVYSWIRDGLYLAISTGDHDVLKVRPNEVGNGLQSVIDLALTFGDHRSEEGKHRLLIVEEPEAFLHPSAVRRLIRSLRKGSATENRQIILTTHSPIVVDESRFHETVLVRRQKFYCPSSRDDRRESINSTLIAFPHAETFFSSAVLLVEGSGEKAFFETVLRRMRSLKEGSILTKLVVQPVGGKASFAPWINLFKSYGDNSDRPIRWLCLMDSDAASKDDKGQRALLRALRDSDFQIPPEVEQQIVGFGNLDYTDQQRRDQEVRRLNTSLSSLSCFLLSVDLEWAALRGDDEGTSAITNRIFSEEGIGTFEKIEDCAKKLGSKLGNGKVVQRPRKDPYLRVRMAEMLPFSTMSHEVELVVASAMGLLLDQTEASALWRKAVEENPIL